MALIEWTETTADELFGGNRFYQWLKSIFAEKNHIHEWKKIDLNNNYATLYVNEQLQLAELRYVRTFGSASADTFYTWHTELIPSEYCPSSQVQGSFNHIGSIYVNSQGTIGGKFAIAFSSSRSCVATVMWRFGLRNIDMTYSIPPIETSENTLLFTNNTGTPKNLVIIPEDFSSIPLPFSFSVDVPSGFGVSSRITILGMDNIQTSTFSTTKNATLKIVVTSSKVEIIVNDSKKISQTYTLTGNVAIQITIQKLLELSNPTLRII